MRTTSYWVVLEHEDWSIFTGHVALEQRNLYTSALALVISYSHKIQIIGMNYGMRSTTSVLGAWKVEPGHFAGAYRVQGLAMRVERQLSTQMLVMDYHVLDDIHSILDRQHP